MDLSGYSLDRLREDPDFVLYRGRRGAGDSPILVLAPRTRKAEARNSGRLEHEHALLPVLDSPWAVKPWALTHYEGRMALVLKDPGGQLLSNAVGKPFDLGYFLQIAVGLAVALRAVHARGLIHKDIKPANTFVDESGAVALTGFGFATRAARERQTPGAPDVIAGTLAYVAPEQTGRVNRSIDNRSDLYALGVTFYEMLVGALPFAASDSMEWIYSHIARAAPPPSIRAEGVPPIVESIVMKLLAKNAEDRYQTAAGVEYDLRRCLNDFRSLRHIESFPLAEHDVSDRLLIPEKLYGREAAISALTTAFEQVASSGQFRFVLVSGYSGVGKSSVVNELHRALYAADGLFATGKVDQYKRDIPYATLAEALQGVVRQILSKDDRELEKWRAALLNAVGANGQLMVDLLPELGLILGDQPAVPSVSPQEAKNRFQLVFRRFMGVFAQPEHPLVLFLDDLQWLDAATLEFLQLIATEDEIPYLLLIGAYRSNEVSATPRLQRALEKIRIGNGALLEVKLAPLTRKDVAQLVAHSLHATAASVKSLADLVYQKTQGNPFFAVQFLTSLNTEELLYFESSTGRWQWDLEGIRTKSITDNVADLMAARLIRYRGDALATIKQFACLGNDASTDTLAKVLGLTQVQVDVALRDFVSAGLIHRIERGYAFAHDGVREAAYSLIPDTERTSMHLRIGRLLSAGVPQKELEENIFVVVNQFNRGVNLIIEWPERLRITELNLIAGKRAKASTAFESALTYLSAGRALLEPDGWNRDRRMAFELEFHQADCKFMLGEVSFAEERLEALSARSENLADLALVVIRQMSVLTYMGRMERAIENGVDCLSRMRAELPVHPTDTDIETEYRLLCSNMGERSIDSLVALPEMQDAHWREVMEVFSGLLTPTGTSNHLLYCLIVLRMANISIEHGNTPESASAYSVLGGFVFGWRVGTFASADAFTQLALNLVTQAGFDRYAARVYAVVAGASGPWSRPLKECYDLAVRSTEMGYEQGGITYSSYAWAVGLSALLDSGRVLTDVQRQADKVLGVAHKLNFPLLIEFITVALGLIRALRGHSASFETFNAEGFDQEVYERRLEGSSHLWHALVRYRIRKLQLQFYAGNYSSCITLIEQLEPEINVLRVFEYAEYQFFSALSRAAWLSSHSGELAKAQFDAMLSSHKALADWSLRCPANFADRATLVEAEIARLEGRELDAERLYERAIRFSREHGSIQNQGLGNELAARFYLARGFDVIAETYLRNARTCYFRWEAFGKVGQLDKLHPHIADDLGGRAVPGLVTETGLQHLDLSAVVQMHQAVSREIVLDRLIERLMVTVIEHAGAVRGLLLLQSAGNLQIAAEAVTDHAAVTVRQRHQVDLAGELPKSVLNYVMRTQEVIILDDALDPNPYSSDVYVRTARPRALMCLPLVKQKRIVGVLYLENNLSSHIFTPARLAVLQLLASQAVISIENAQLFLEVQEAKEQARRVSDELRRSFDMMPALAWRAAPDGTFEFSNQQWHDYTGISAEEARNGTWIRAFHPDDVDKVRVKWGHLSKFGTSGEFEARMRRFDGELRSFLVRVTPMRDEDGTIVKWHGTNTDIENLKRAEQAQEALARVSRVTAMGELTVSIAHEVNQPLMAIVTNAATCLRWLADEQLDIREARLAAQRIIRDGHRAGDVIASIRTLAKKSPPQAEAIDLNSVILEVLSLTRNELDRNSITAETHLATNLGTALGDRVQIQQVLLNLIMNGIEAINVSHYQSRILEIRTNLTDSGFVVVSIADTGVGLDPAGGDRIFDVFFTTKPDGIGIGLSICRSIVEAHHGRLWASPNEPHGSIFSFTVPRFTGSNAL
jgi:PAS domain S-box-containing protein